jgi:hypothetical protein
LWLQVEVRDANGAFVPLAERERWSPRRSRLACAGMSTATPALCRSPISSERTDGAALRIQAAAGVGVNTFAPQASLHVRSGATFLSNATPDPGTIINAEKATATPSSASWARPSAAWSSASPTAPPHGGVFYDNAGNAALDFRTGGNVARMQLGVSDDDGAGDNGSGKPPCNWSEERPASYLSAFDIAAFRTWTSADTLAIGSGSVPSNTIGVPLIACREPRNRRRLLVGFLASRPEEEHRSARGRARSPAALSRRATSSTRIRTTPMHPPGVRTRLRRPRKSSRCSRTG